MHSSPYSSLCSAWLCSSSLLFHSATVMRLHHAFLLFHSKAMLDACHYLMLLLRLSTPNISITDLVVSFFSSYLIRLTYDSHAVPMLLFSFHIMPHALLTPFIFMQCMAMPSFSSFILPPLCGCLMHHFVSISWPCLMHTPTSCY